MASKVVLIVAAEEREFSGLLKFVEVRPLNWGLRFSSEGELNGSKVILIADGPGMQLAGAATDVARRFVRPAAVASAGFCGALDPELKPGTVVVAESVVDPENGDTFVSRAPGCDRQVSKGVVASVNRVVGSLEERAALRRTGARAVEMEAAAVAARARVWDVPFYCIRAVSDAVEHFPIDFNRLRDPQGRFSRSRIALAAALRPWSRVPFLLRLDRSCRMASERLGEFFANCRF